MPRYMRERRGACILLCVMWIVAKSYCLAVVLSLRFVILYDTTANLCLNPVHVIRLEVSGQNY